MPYLRCTDEECGHHWAPASRFEDQCPECGAAGPPAARFEDQGPGGGAPGVPVDSDGDERAGEMLAVPGRPGREEDPHPAHARHMARRVLVEHNITKPPVPVHAVARRAG